MEMIDGLENGTSDARPVERGLFNWEKHRLTGDLGRASIL